MGKKISYMLWITPGNIIDKRNWPNNKIDTIVNAADPTLMGSNTPGVDKAIHDAVDAALSTSGTSLNKKICEELKTLEDKRVRCKRGHAICTKGYEFCDWIIHAVGIPYDGLDKNGNISSSKMCTSSCINTLESCYYEIINELKKHLDIKVVGIPIIGSGHYKFPFELAARIAIVSVGNALAEWKRQDEEMFEMSALDQILFFVYDADYNKQWEYYQTAEEVKMEYYHYFSRNKTAVLQKSLIGNLRCIKEISKYDKQRGYFFIAKSFRWFLMAFRLLFYPINAFKDFTLDWEWRRGIVECTAIIKAVLVGIILCILYGKGSDITVGMRIGSAIIAGYFMADTLTYLLSLISLADIQRPSANIIRSIILLFINYIETAIDLAILYYTHYAVQTRGVCALFFKSEESWMGKALTYGFLGELGLETTSIAEYIFLFMNSGVKFFFLTIVFGYFFNHMHQRKFRS